MNEIDDIEFDNILDLYNRVKPALTSKIKELEREKLEYIKQEDIWNYLIKNKWQNAHDLKLCDVVNDILHIDNKELDKYVKEITSKREVEVEELEIL